MKRINISLALVFLAMPLFFTSCDKNKESDLTLHFHAKVGADDFAFNQNFTVNGQTVQFTLAQFYLHGFTVEGAAANETIDKYYLVKAGQMMYAADKVATGEINALSFNIGVDSVTNGQTEEGFTTRDSNDPLAQQDPAMHWNWNTGYIFVKIEGLVDTDGDGTPEQVFQRHIGRNEMYRLVNIPLTNPLEITGDTYTLNFDVDYAKILENEDIIGTPMIHGMSANLMDNMTGMFSLQ